MKRFSRRLDAFLAAYKGGQKPKRQKVTETVSPYGDVEGASFEGPFGSGTSGFGAADPVTGKRQIVTNMTLAPSLQQAGETASTGLNANLGYLQRDPNERVDYLRSGQDPLYNVLNRQAQDTFSANLGRQRLNAQQAGASNSTAAGAAYGQLMRDKNLLDNQILLQGLNFGNENARADANVNLGAIGNLAQLAYPLGSAANAQFNTALQDQGRAQAATANSKNQAEATYTNAQNQYNANRGAGLGSGIGSIIGTVGGAALGSIVPGVGTMIGAQLGGALGGGVGGAIQGSPTQYSSMPYIPNTFSPSYGGAVPLTPPSYNFGNVSGYGMNSPLFTNLSSPVY